MAAYHDTEWGVPSREDEHLYAMLVLESAQSGLSWRTILHKREGYRRCFAGFDAAKVAEFGPRDVTRLLGDAGIVRHRAKIESAITNAQAVLDVASEHGSFSAYLWSFTNGGIVKNRWKMLAEVPAQSELSVIVARDLRRKGFRFLGPTTVYSYLQAVGVVDDHLVTCPRY